MGSKEVSPIEEYLSKENENAIILTLKLRIVGGVKDQ